jgi:CRISPR-associated endoribonuclease Cas6
VRYVKISATFKSQKKPPLFIGSQIRGAFGHALKESSCINPLMNCHNCFASKNCCYFDFFEEQNRYQSYRFDFLLGKEYYDFSLFLFEQSVAYTPLILATLHKMLTQIGLGFQRTRYNDIALYINDQNVYKDGSFDIPKHYCNSFRYDNFSHKVKVKLCTPLRIKRDNRYIRSDSLNIEDILRSLNARKQSLLCQMDRHSIQTQTNMVDKNLQYIELTRKSSRQKTHMQLGGLMGEMTIENLSPQEYALLKLGELIGVGKQTTFGLGKIKVEDLV